MLPGPPEGALPAAPTVAVCRHVRERDVPRLISFSGVWLCPRHRGQQKTRTQ